MQYHEGKSLVDFISFFLKLSTHLNTLSRTFSVLSTATLQKYEINQL